MDKLCRSKDDKILLGVCSGLAKYLSISTTGVRLAVVLLSIFSGLGIIGYLIAALLMPRD